MKERLEEVEEEIARFEAAIDCGGNRAAELCERGRDTTSDRSSEPSKEDLSRAMQEWKIWARHWKSKKKRSSVARGRRQMIRIAECRGGGRPPTSNKKVLALRLWYSDLRAGCADLIGGGGPDSQAQVLFPGLSPVPVARQKSLLHHLLVLVGRRLAFHRSAEHGRLFPCPCHTPHTVQLTFIFLPIILVALRTLGCDNSHNVRNSCIVSSFCRPVPAP